jgi:hypothetical protein
MELYFRVFFKFTLLKAKKARPISQLYRKAGRKMLRKRGKKCCGKAGQNVAEKREKMLRKSRKK